MWLMTRTIRPSTLRFSARPDAVRGLQVGFSAYHDCSRQQVSENRRNYFAAHAVLIRPKFEWLNEILLVRHAPNGIPRVFNTPGFYTQLSKTVRLVSALISLSTEHQYCERF